MVQLRNRNSINLHFRHGMPTPTRVQFPACFLQMQIPGRGCGHRGENYLNAGDAYF